MKVEEAVAGVLCLREDFPCVPSPEIDQRAGCAAAAPLSERGKLLSQALHFGGVALAMEVDEATNGADVGVFRVQAYVPQPHGLAHFIEQIRRWWSLVKQGTFYSSVLPSLHFHKPLNSNVVLMRAAFLALNVSVRSY
jgi:hypothetical protein